MILQVNKMYSPDIGGVETVVKEYSEYLKEYDDVTILCCHKNFSFKTTKEFINGVKVYRCASFGTYMSMPVSIVFFFYLFFLSRKANFIHFHEPFPLGTLGSLLVPKSKKIFVTWHSDIIKQKKIKNIFESFQRLLCNKSTHVITTSENLAISSSVLSKFKERVIIIPLSINTIDYLNVEVDGHDQFFLPSDYVLYLGRFSYYKGIYVLLDAFEILDSNIPLVIVGHGELVDEIKSRLKEENKNIILIDKFVTDHQKKILLKKSKFLVFPSIYSSEAFGILQLEAMIFSKPVINTYLPTGVPWVSLHGNTGITVSPNCAKELSDAIKKLYFDDNLINLYGDNAKHRVIELFDSKKTNKLLFEVYFGEKEE